MVYSYNRYVFMKMFTLFVLLLMHMFLSETFPGWLFILESSSCVYTVGFENIMNHTSGFRT